METTNQNPNKPYVVLAMNPGHNGSAALVVNGEVVYYAEEERLSKFKYDGNPVRVMLEAIQSCPWPVDEFVIGGAIHDLPKLPWTGEDPYTSIVRKFNNNLKVTNMSDDHHIGHAASAFYGSGFDSAVAVIVDGAGSSKQGHYEDKVVTMGFETESIFKCSYPDSIVPLYKRHSDGLNPYYNDGVNEWDPSITIVKSYEAVTQYLGFASIEAGKTMGLAPYGQYDDNIPQFFIKDRGNKNLVIPQYPMGALIDVQRYDYLNKGYNAPGYRDWHNNFDACSEVEKNLAWAVQNETEEQVIKLIQKAIDITGETNVVLSGGYGLNCVANYKFIKHFPDINFYVDPVSHDGGTSIGLARLAWHKYSQDITKRPLKSLYLGMTPNYQNMESTEKQLSDVISVTETNPEEVAELLVQGNIVTLFQGRAEGGPRALGNRSIIFDPRRHDGKDFVNQVKHREWFRPFAGSVLEEKASEWFEMENLKSSPFMMYAVDVKLDKIDQIPAVTHVDNTCRVQTVNQEENLHYYNLIQEFYKKTGVPVIFNTSLNLAGEPLCETVEDAIMILLRSDMEYLYLPEINRLVKKINKQ